MAFNHEYYSKHDAREYVELLGCWTFINPREAADKRDLREYLEMLKALIRLNQGRKDNIGKWETEKAKEVLAKYGVTSPSAPHK